MKQHRYYVTWEEWESPFSVKTKKCEEWFETLHEAVEFFNLIKEDREYIRVKFIDKAKE